MVNTGLDRKYTAKEGQSRDFSPIPDGTYRARVKEVTEWTPKTQNIMVIQKDENGNALENEKGEKIKELVNNCTFYNCNVKMEIIGGEYNGRIVFHNLTTHPNKEFIIPAFLYGIGMDNLSANEISTKTIGKECDVVVYTDSYTKVKQDPETGLDKEEIKYVNRIRTFKKLETPTIEIEDNDLGF